MSDSEQFLTVTPLGGLGEIGLNCQLWETSAGVVMVDCGLMFPDDFHLGVDVVIPHFGAVSAVRDKLLGIVLTRMKRASAIPSTISPTTLQLM